MKGLLSTGLPRLVLGDLIFTWRPKQVKVIELVYQTHFRFDIIGSSQSHGNIRSQGLCYNIWWQIFRCYIWFSLNRPTGAIQSLSHYNCLCVCESVPFFAFFFNVLLFQFTKVKSPIDQLQKDSLGNSSERTLVSDLTIWAQKWTKLMRGKKFVWSSTLIADWSSSRSAPASYCA